MYSENILILTYWPFNDALIQTYTLPYIKIIRSKLASDKKIWLRTLEPKVFSSAEKERILNNLSECGIEWLPERYQKVGMLSYFKSIVQLIQLFVFCIKNDIKVIHSWCTPPAVIGHLLSMMTGAKLIIDSYEPHAEAMVENGAWDKRSFVFRVLFFFEKLMSRRASIIISATQGMREYAKIKYNVVFEKFYVKPACVDLELFSLEKVKNPDLLRNMNLEEKVVLVYAGKFGGIYLEQEVFDFVKVAYDFYGPKFRFLVLTSHKRDEIVKYCKTANLPENMVISIFVAHADVPMYMGLADFAITPVKPVPSKRYCTPIKDGEYWALGLPVVITRNISDDSSIIHQEQIGAVINDFNETSYKTAIYVIDGLLKQDRKLLQQKIRTIAKKYRSFELAERIYSQIYY